MATPLAAIRAGAEVQFVDCNRDDLCMSFADFERAAEQHKPRAAFLVHIGGHIAFEVEQIAAVLRRERHLPDRGLRPRPRRAAGTVAGPAPGVMPASTRCTPPRRSPPARAACSSPAARRSIEHARDFRNYGKPSYEVPGLNFRMSEFTAALGLVQIERLPEIVAWKNEAARQYLDPQHPSRLQLPDGMVSGSLQVHRVRLAGALDRPRLRRAVSPDHGSRDRAAQLRLGGAKPLVRSAVLQTEQLIHARSRHRRLRIHRLPRRRQAPRPRARAGHLRPAPVALAYRPRRPRRHGARLDH